MNSSQMFPVVWDSDTILDPYEIWFLKRHCLFNFQALADDEKRKIYDAHGEEGLKKMGAENGHDTFDSFNRYSANDAHYMLY